MKRKLFLIAMLLIIGLSIQAQRAYITNSSDNSISVIDVTTGMVIDTIILNDSPFGVTVSSDGSKVYVTNYNANTVSVIDAVHDTVIATIAVNQDPWGICVSPNGNEVYVVACSTNGSISVINPITNTVSTSFAIGHFPRGVCFSPDGSYAYVTDTQGFTVGVINTSTHAINSINVGLNPWGIVSNLDGSKVYVAINGENNIKVISTSSNTVTNTIGVGVQPVGLALSVDGSKLYVTNEGGNTVNVISTLTELITDTIAVDQSPLGISVSPDGSKVYVACNGTNYVDVINTATNIKTNTITAGYQPVSFGNFISNYVSPVSVSIAATADPICQGDSTTLTVSGASNYSWSNGLGTASSIVVSPATTTSYSVIGNSSGVLGAAALVVTVNPYPPAATLTTPDNLTDIHSAPVTLNGTPVGGTYTGDGITGIVFNPLLAGLGKKTIHYSFTNSFGCSSNITVNTIVYDTLGNVCTSHDTVTTHLSVTDTLVINAVLTGITQTGSNNTFSVYPNPTYNKLTIESPEKSTIEILDVQGQIILQQQLQQGKTDIDISRLAKGVYILRLYNNDKTEVTRIVKE